MKIALFDSGVDTKRCELNQKRIHHVKTYLYKKDKQDNIGHGTAIAFILQKKIENLDILSYKLFDNNYFTSEDEIIFYLCDIYNNHPEIKLINISSGVTYIKNYKSFYEACEKLKNRGCIIVSAYDNEGSISYPAAFDNTIGVFWDLSVRNVSDFFYIENSPLEILGYAGNQRLPWTNGDFRCVGGSSFATPYITAKIAEYQKNKKNIIISEVKKKLRRDAKKIYKAPLPTNKNEQKEILKSIKEMGKAIVFPLNKETHALIGNSDLLSFKLIGAYDYKYSNNIARNTKNLVFGESVLDLIIQRFEDINWDDEFDTIIVGHLKLINELMKKNYNSIILKKCIKYKKNCFFFDDITEYKSLIDELNSIGNFAISHHIHNLNLAYSPSGSYHRISNPVMAIVGTSPQQGKYNLQLSLRRRFLYDKYNIGQISTEPSGHLFGMEICFSNGYDNQYECSNFQEILYLNEAAFQLCKKELIIIGTQSQMIPMQYGNLGFLTYHQQNTLIALEPDCTVLCVNYDDDKEYVHRTIQVLLNYYMTKVIAIVIYPLYRQREWNVSSPLTKRVTIEQVKKIKDDFFYEFNIPTYINGDITEMDRLYHQCIEFFC